jgi:hypothetical protein
MMSLNDLLAPAFQYGAGISLGYALRTDRCRDLQVAARADGLPTPNDFGSVEYLGERIADRAAQNLPQDVRRHLGLWQLGTAKQEELLGILKVHLSSDHWRAADRSREKFTYNSNAGCVLPHQMGSWEDGLFMPNCLGVAQMLVGFAREVGARHYLVNVIEPSQRAMSRLEARTLRLMLQVLKQHPNRNRMLGSAIDATHRAYLRSLGWIEHFGQAHHALMIQLDDGKWWLVDPYMGLLYPLADEEGGVRLSELDRQRNAVMAVDEEGEGLFKWHEDTLVKLQSTLEILLFMIRARFEKGIFEAGAPLILARVLGYGLDPDVRWDEGFEDRLLILAADVLDFEQSEAFQEVAAQSLLWATCPHTGDEDPDLSRYERLIKRSMKDVVLEERICWRLVAYMMFRILIYINLMNEDRHLVRHPAYEAASPAAMIGVATLNHLRLEFPDVRLSGQLAALSSSQWVLADTLTAEERGDLPEGLYRLLIDDTLKRFSQLPKSVLVHPLHHLVQNRRENGYGQPQAHQGEASRGGEGDPRERRPDSGSDRRVAS